MESHPHCDLMVRANPLCYVYKSLDQHLKKTNQRLPPTNENTDVFLWEVSHEAGEKASDI